MMQTAVLRPLLGRYLRPPLVFSFHSVSRRPSGCFRLIQHVNSVPALSLAGHLRKIVLFNHSVGFVLIFWVAVAELVPARRFWLFNQICCDMKMASQFIFFVFAIMFLSLEAQATGWWDPSVHLCWCCWFAVSGAKSHLSIPCSVTTNQSRRAGQCDSGVGRLSVRKL